MQPATKTLVKRSQTLQTSFLSKVGTLGQGLVQGKLNGVNFTKIQTIIDEMKAINATLQIAQANSSTGFYKIPLGKMFSTGLKVATVVVGCGCAAWVIYNEINQNATESSSNNTTGTDSSTVGATLVTIGTTFLHMINNEFKNYMDKEARSLELSPPKPQEELESTESAIHEILTVIQNSGPTAKEALEKYQSIYPILPSKIKKILPDPQFWHPDIIDKITSAASTGLSLLPQDSDEDSGEDNPQLVVHVERDE